MVHNHANTHLSIQYKIGSQNNNQDYTDLFNKGFQTIKQEAGLPGFHLVIGQLTLQVQLLV